MRARLAAAWGVFVAGLLAPDARAEPAACRSQDPSQWPTPARPYFMLAVDTSGSMLSCTNPSSASYDFPNSCPISALPNVCGLEPTRLNDAKCALTHLVQSYGGDVNFGLTTFAVGLTGCGAGACSDSCTNTSGTCTPPSAIGTTGEFYPGSGCSAFAPPNAVAPAGCGNAPDCAATNAKLFDGSVVGNASTPPLLGGGSITLPSDNWRNGGRVVVGVNKDPFWAPATKPASNVPTLLSWFDGQCTSSRELFAIGNTPLEGILRTVHQYFAAGWSSSWADANYCLTGGPAIDFPSPIDPANDRPCRSLNVILVTDGDETCSGNAVTAAAALNQVGVVAQGVRVPIRTYVIGLPGATLSALDAIAAAGGTTSSFLASNEVQLSQAMAAILSSAQPAERCNNADDNCNGCTDEGSRVYCNRGKTPRTLAFLQGGSATATDCCSWATGVERSACLSAHAASITAAQPQGDLRLLPCWNAATDTSLIETKWLCVDPGDPCDEADNNCEAEVSSLLPQFSSNLADEKSVKCPKCPAAETCNGIDDNCDSLVDNGGVCGGGCVPTVETCNGCDDDCDGVADDGVAASPCGFSPPAQCAGVRSCLPATAVAVGGCVSGVTQPGVNRYGACSSSPTAETTCNGLDDNCNDVVDDNVAPSACTGAQPAGLVYSDTNAKSQCVKGLQACGSAACIGLVGPSIEICDDLDNDCDGLVDAADPDLVGVGGLCGSAAGTCQKGTVSCVGGALVCSGGSTPQPETCDGADNDCNGLTDDGDATGALTDSPPDPGCWTVPGNTCQWGSTQWGMPAAATCTTLGSLLAPCRLGNLICQSGTWKCVDATSPTPEICDGLDNDCDAQVDQADADLTGIGVACGSSVGDCTPGVTQCTNGKASCTGQEAAPEVCDGHDNDCDGLTDGADPDITGVGVACSSSVGECTPGVSSCVGGVLLCNGTNPAPELCDGLDNDCDGVADEAGAAPGGVDGTADPADSTRHVGDSCGLVKGACLAGVYGCVGASFVCIGGTVAAPEICDGLDNDCNDAVDDGLTGLGEPCEADAGACQSGRTACQSGRVVCAGKVGPKDETCNGVDDDCDGVIDNDVPLGGDCPMIFDAAAYPGARTAGLCRVGKSQCDGKGAFLCIQGVAPAPEVCDGLDNDCDGQIDETGAAPDGVDGTSDPVDPARVLGGACGPVGNGCVQGTIRCTSGALVCEGDSCAVNPCDPNPCSAAEVCRPTSDLESHTCTPTCAGVHCEPGSICRNGACEPTGCTDVGDTSNGCAAGEICNVSTSGQAACTVNLCAAPGRPACTGATYCNPVTGACDGTDPCRGVVCPGAQQCDEGECVFADAGAGSAPGVEGGAIVSTSEKSSDYAFENGGKRAEARDTGSCSFSTRSSSGQRGGWLMVAAVGLIACLRRLPRRTVLATMTASAVLFGCSGEPKDKGGLVVSIQTDMSIPKDVDRMRLEVEQGGKRVFWGEYELGPKGQRIPATVALKAGKNPAQAVTLRLISLKTAHPVTLREAVLPIPVERTALLRLPIEWLCAGQVRVANGRVESTCDEGQTCIEGSCASSQILIEDLPSFGPGEATGGGGPDDGDGACFDTLQCFASASAVSVNLDDCSLAAPAGGDGVNVALVRPPGTEGICGPEVCLVPLDEGTFAKTSEGRLTLPEAACDRLQSGDVLGVAVTTSCATKTKATPTCGAWSSANQGQSTLDAAAPTGITSAGGGTVTQTIGAEGGSLRSPGGRLGLDVPAGAVPDPTEFSITPATPVTTGVVGAGFDVQPAGATFGTLTVSIGYDLAQIGSTSPSRLLIAIETDGKWVPLADITVDTVTHRVSGHTDHLGVFALIVGPDVASTCKPGTIPTPEVCDGIDNDCDGATDDADADLATADITLGKPCFGGTLGECARPEHEGVTVCRAGSAVCENGPATTVLHPGQATETCNLKDDDCDGSVDEFPEDAGGPCGKSVGVCRAGVQTCVNGGLSCSGEVTGTPEKCNGLDDDCNGASDDTFSPRPGTPCFSDDGLGFSHGPCRRSGVISCKDETTVTCVGPDLTKATAEVCNGRDDDCDGLVDSADPDMASSDPQLGKPCTGGLLGECADLAKHGGALACVSGALRCQGSNLLAPGQKPETCDSEDNDCNGQVDDKPTDVGSPCGSSQGACRPGITACIGGAPVCQGATAGSQEVCNGVDDDCNGTRDDNLTGLGSACNVPQPTPAPTAACPVVTQPCSAGTTQCTAGALQCVSSQLPTQLFDGCCDDSNCDGLLTNQPNFQTDAKNCGACGNDCSALAPGSHSLWSCVAGSCLRTGCAFGFVDCDGNANDCERACTPTSAELCNGFDDDCNCAVDDAIAGVPSAAQVCGVSVSASDPSCTSVLRTCVAGAWQCTFGAGYCSGGTPPGCATTPDVCDGKDNNCDGNTDEPFKAPLLASGGLGQPCYSDAGQAPPGDGVCRTAGSYICSGTAATQCNAVKNLSLAGPELCDGLDNDCDGSIDEIFTSKGTNATYFMKPAVIQLSAALWIYRYEASRPTADNVLPGTGNGYTCASGCGAGITPAPVGTTLDKTPACSVQGKIPWANVTPAEVEQTCQAMGGAICSTSTWQTACKGTANCTWAYGTACSTAANYGGAGPYCNLGGYDFGGGGAPDGDGLLPTASPVLPNCFSSTSGGPVYDLTGNLREITKFSVGAYSLMGGGYTTADDGGATCNYTFLSVSSSYQHATTGFRCCFTTNPTL